ncbi:hypothetical protein [Adhaeribacter pallidiroseus]|uniref:Uncharacterized protein n=1 Tax=Adhaeribacter pallidiroseus TaxID=2072847 RepID=A0A369QSC3_9BACT|nr:hypothetical protein [Adhaeribacter pallidiroseus]RDC66117.1 hypothetical protein AHMF7616_04748 [Adhaeribacter pallidiroseus]
MKTSTASPNKDLKANLILKNNYLRSLLLFFLSFLFILIVIAIDIIFIHNHSVSGLWEGGFLHRNFIYELIEENKPQFNELYLTRTALIGSSSFLLIYGIKLFSHSKKEQCINDNTKENTIELFAQGRIPVKIKKAIILTVISCSITFIALFIKNPEKFSDISREDQLIEIITAYLFFLSSAIFIYLSFKLKHQLISEYKSVLAISILFGLCFFVIGMEEISWFQRIFTIKTPKIFEGNIQNEMNLHNFYSNETENVFYFFHLFS